jgi:hypothetical protein
MNARQVLAGRREGELLAFPSVERMATILSERCREPSWVRTSVASLDRFRTMTGHSDLEALLHQARAEPTVAEQALVAFAAALAGYTESQVSGLAMGAKIWFRLNGVVVSWRPLAGRASPPALPTISQQPGEQVILLALIGSGLQLAELLRLRLGDVGSLDREGCLIPDIEADPLAVQFTPHRGKHTQRITFLTYQARQALLASLEHSLTAGQPLDPTMPLICQSDGSKATSASVHQARRRSRSLIETCSNTNVALCRATGDFFRQWGLPGSRFEGPEELNLEEYI